MIFRRHRIADIDTFKNHKKTVFFYSNQLLTKIYLQPLHSGKNSFFDSERRQYAPYRGRFFWIALCPITRPYTREESSSK